MGLIERIASKVFLAVFDRVWSLVEAKIKETLDTQAIIRHHDKVSSEMREKLRAANTTKEIDAILIEMHNYGVDS